MGVILLETAGFQVRGLPHPLVEVNRHKRTLLTNPFQVIATPCADSGIMVFDCRNAGRLGSASGSTKSSAGHSRHPSNIRGSICNLNWTTRCFSEKRRGAQSRFCNLAPP